MQCAFISVPLYYSLLQGALLPWLGAHADKSILALINGTSRQWQLVTKKAQCAEHTPIGQLAGSKAYGHHTVMYPSTFQVAHTEILLNMQGPRWDRRQPRATPAAVETTTVVVWLATVWGHVQVPWSPLYCQRHMFTCKCSEAPQVHLQVEMGVNRTKSKIISWIILWS